MAATGETRHPRPCSYGRWMRVYEMVVAERRRMADLLAGLPDWSGPTLCAEWTVHDLAAHLVSLLHFGQVKLYAGVALTAGDLDRVNLALTRWYARGSRAELLAELHRRVGSRTTVPRAGFDPVLTDLLLHDLDIRLPRGLPRDPPEDRWWVAFNHLTTRPALGYGMGARLGGLRIETTDTGWAAGAGALVRGDAQSVLLAISGRAAGFDGVTGDGVRLLRDRVTTPPHPGAVRRVARALAAVIRPPAPERRSRTAVAPSDVDDGAAGELARRLGRPRPDTSDVDGQGAGTAQSRSRSFSSKPQPR
jgi:uncharacterized protein (TIGR03083 family)